MNKNFLALRLGLWFLILSILPLGILAVFVLDDVALGFNELSLAYQQEEAQLLANNISAAGGSLSILKEHYQGDEEKLYLISPEGNYLYHPNSAKIGTSIQADFDPETTAWILAGESGAMIEPESELVIGLAPLKGQDALLIATTPNTRSQALLSSIRRSTQTRLLVGLLIISIAGGFAIWIVVGQPVRQLTRTAEQIGLGNLDAKIDPEDTVDELQVLAITFNQMTDQLSQSFNNLEQKIIDLHKAENALRISEEYFRALTDNSQDIITVLDINGNIRFESPSIERVLGYKPEEMINNNVFSYIHPDDLEKVGNVFQQTLAENMPAKVEFRFIHQDGSYRYFESIGQNLLENPAVKGIVVNSRNITNRKKAEADLLEAYDTTLEGWASALELRDKETENHSRRVTELTLALAEAMGIQGKELVHIQRGAILHDIGKMGIPDEILRKPGKLTDAEFEIIKQHPVHSLNLLSRIPFLEKSIDIPYCHHERWDGSGYPRGLKGKEIPLAARIFSVIDVWDAVQSDRPYNHAWSREDTVHYLREQSGKHFDPECIEAFLGLVEKGEI